VPLGEQGGRHETHGLRIEAIHHDGQRAQDSDLQMKPARSLRDIGMRCLLHAAF
jgi:putative hemolysin